MSAPICNCGELTPVQFNINKQASVDTALATASAGGEADVLINKSNYEIAGAVEHVWI